MAEDKRKELEPTHVTMPRFAAWVAVGNMKTALGRISNALATTIIPDDHLVGVIDILREGHRESKEEHARTLVGMMGSLCDGEEERRPGHQTWPELIRSIAGDGMGGALRKAGKELVGTEFPDEHLSEVIGTLRTTQGETTGEIADIVGEIIDGLTARQEPASEEAESVEEGVEAGRHHLSGGGPQGGN